LKYFVLVVIPEFAIDMTMNQKFFIPACNDVPESSERWIEQSDLLDCLMHAAKALSANQKPTGGTKRSKTKSRGFAKKKSFARAIPTRPQQGTGETTT
jgi:hypothetical protein